MRKSCLAAAAVGWVLAAGQARAASTLSLSDITSDETPPAQLSGALEFSVGGNFLKLRALNLTGPGASFNIRAIFFNAPQNVTALIPLSENTGWTTVANAEADGFGIFRFGVLADQQLQPVFIGPGQSLDMAFAISGSGPLHDEDFSSYWSSPGQGQRAALGAAWFVDGPDGDSSVGAAIPEPATCLLLAMGGMVIAAFRRRRP